MRHLFSCLVLGRSNRSDWASHLDANFGPPSKRAIQNSSHSPAQIRCENGAALARTFSATLLAGWDSASASRDVRQTALSPALTGLAPRSGSKYAAAMSSSATISFARVSSGSATGIGGPHQVLGSSPAGSFTQQHHLLGSSPPVHSKHLLGSSPPVSSKQLGSSPPVSASCGVLGLGGQASKQHTGSDKQAPCTAAKKFLRRLQHDPALEPSEFTVSGMRKGLG